ncbi:hypothetical protein THASP1DRAFT_25633 [Thamnocephalis sphaerospora]|uniref:Uncharacterized protein n=1 Tax=Thamnocephalis sphaerospora TaxID=78915 RepID=A0A4P9XJL4_9FUNG|nr:hypothetical protein THASP1DRAFT_25633 [Thamnocephalis sphaerospora]|eukprot:RKP05957.1 hypothetical protein THASP1DRAFT_25633 [Thamnocephalis sphaerospora]
MRVTSLLGITAAVTLAALALAGSSADAAIIPSSSSQPAAPEPSSSDFVTIPDEYTDFKQYSKLFTLEPHFAVFQPKGTRMQYDRDEKGRVRVIKAINSKNEVVSEMLVIHKLESDQIDSIFIEDYSQGGSTMSDSAFVTFKYDKETNMINHYGVVTPRGSAWTETEYVRRRKDDPPVEPEKEPAKFMYFLDLGYKKTLPLKMQPWNGKEIKLLAAPDATNA